MANKMHFGLTLPHFGEYASPSRLVEGAKKAEEYGFDSLWVRDHLIYRPHSWESQDRTFLEPFTVLSAMSSVTDEISLGTLVVIPTRHPLHLAQHFASLHHISGGRVLAGIGAGAFKHEFDAVGMPYGKRQQLVVENIEIMQRLWEETGVSYEGEVFSFENIEMFPQPKNDIELWFGGKSPAAMDIAVEYADGWDLGRTTLKTARARYRQMKRRAEELNQKPPSLGALVPTSIDEIADDARVSVDIDRIIDVANQREWWVSPESGVFSSLEDIRGAIMVGDPTDIAAEIRAFRESGVDKITIDLRHRFDEFERCLDLLGSEVLPEFS